MILSSHIVVASALTAPLINQPIGFLNSVLVFVLSLLSHYAVDAIPHWDYRLNSFVKIFDENGVYRGEKKFIPELFKKDLLKFLIDGISGLLLAVMIIGFPNTGGKLIMFSLSVFGALLPDLLQFYGAVANSVSQLPQLKILKSEYLAHIRIHSKIVLENRPVLGILTQILIVATIVLLIR